jgi:hypothetical protein
VKALAIGLLAATVALGILLGVSYLGRRRRPSLATIHLLLGAAGIELLLLLLHWTPAGIILPTGTGTGTGTAAAWATGLLAAAMALGLFARLSFRRTPGRAEAMLGAHAIAGVAGLLVFLSWASRL